MSARQIGWDLTLIQRYNYSRPRYTSYPTALGLSEDFNEQAFLQATACYPERLLSLYVYIPLCRKLCYFCGCNKIVTHQQHKTDQYLDALEQEIVHRVPLFAERHVSQLHRGGGTPMYLNKAQTDRLTKLLRENFQLNADAEISIEADPRGTELDVLDRLRAEGFNRLSVDVRGFNKGVQRLVNRGQGEGFIFALLNHAREIDFTSTNIDLICGLPKQTPESFIFTLKRVTELNPDRLSVFNYAYLPIIFVAQRKTKDTDLPSPQQKLGILQETVAFLTQSGYQFIGMDHFARPGDELTVIQRGGVLHRNSQGYTIRSDTDLLGMGISVINMIDDCYAQNQKELKQYYQQVGEQGSVLWRGITLTRDDCIRRDVIKSLICNFRLDYSSIEQQQDLLFADHFVEDLKLLAPLAKDGPVDVDEKGIQVTAKGYLLIRNTCMCFDTYLRQEARTQQLPWVI